MPVGVFRNKSIPEAIKLYLQTGRRKQTTKEIAAGLKAHGLVSTAKHFERTVNGTLHRLKMTGMVLRFKDGWDLAESYPDHLNSRLGNGVVNSSKPKAKPSKGTRRNSKRKSKARPKIGLDARIESILKENQTKVFSPDKISKMINVGERGVRLALGRMAKKKMAIKMPEGGYTAYREEFERGA